MLPSGKRENNASSISLPSLWQHYLVAMATSLDKLENKVQIHHLHAKRFHMVKRLRKSVQYIRRYLTKSPNHIAFPSVSLFSVETTSPKILHIIVTLVALFNLAYTRHYPIPYLYISYASGCCHEKFSVAHDRAVTWRV